MHENSFASCFSVCVLIERVVIVLERRSLREMQHLASTAWHDAALEFPVLTTAVETSLH